MATSAIERSDRRQSALTAGISLIIMAAAAFFSYGFVHGSLVVESDAGATFSNLMSSTTLFKAEILGWILILIADIVVAWAFYVFLKPIHQGFSCSEPGSVWLIRPYWEQPS